MRYIRIDNVPGSRPGNPFVQALGLVVGILAFVVAVFIGGLVLAALIGFVLVAGFALYVRIWWLTRKVRRQRQQREDSFVDAEYEVIDRTGQRSEQDGRDT